MSLAPHPSRRLEETHDLRLLLSQSSLTVPLVTGSSRLDSPDSRPGCGRHNFQAQKPTELASSIIAASRGSTRELASAAKCMMSAPATASPIFTNRLTMQPMAQHGSPCVAQSEDPQHWTINPVVPASPMERMDTQLTTPSWMGELEKQLTYSMQRSSRLLSMFLLASSHHHHTQAQSVDTPTEFVPVSSMFSLAHIPRRVLFIAAVGVDVSVNNL